MDNKLFRSFLTSKPLFFSFPFSPSFHQIPTKPWRSSPLFLLTAAVISLCILIGVAFGSDIAVTSPRPYSHNTNTTDSSFTRTSRYLTMRDGVKIAVDVYLPADMNSNDRLPTLLHQIRYWRAVAYQWPLSIVKNPETRGYIGIFAKRFLANGYAWVDVDVRGSGASFGKRRFSHSPEEIQDGAEVVEWIIHQPWSNGRVGSIGISYGGASAELLLANQHPVVKAAAPLFSGFDLYPEIAFPGGIQLTWFTKTWSYINHQLDSNALPFAGWFTKFLIQGVSPVDTDPEGTLLAAAIQDHQLNWDPHTEGLGITFRDDPPPSRSAPNIDALSPFTSSPALMDSGAAIYSYSGWLDGGYQHGAIRRHLTLTNPGNKLIIGPWDHGGKRNISPTNIGPSAFDHGGELLKFFDYHLKGVTNGITQEKPIHYFTMVEDQWKAIDHWLPASTLTTYYFGPNHSLSSQALDEHGGSDSYMVNPTVGTGRQTRWNTLVGKPITNPYPHQNQKSQKLLLYTSDPLDQDTEVTGHPLITL